MHYVESHSYRMAYNLACEVCTSEDMPDGFSINLSAKPSGQKTQWCDKALVYHNELNILDLLSDVTELHELRMYHQAKLTRAARGDMRAKTPPKH